ncbi:RNA polymerase II transcription factor [Cordyceps fumosorosea ARSEF 2679]|uniref:RNA polymerase II transcription factor n=1 Tax=Cordyceps fumosorosea (strain ARSEF 2679) TaxID=1081104 RepID=A0A167RQ97_CORFA|nr:RNA polymerase II transcription factor [Cordyceps fumosorosea ARSEF 2679]OAA58825.1 RNA polymerase II transcription factor [Cordyceps fumosorosea ARSEF 2679]
MATTPAGRTLYKKKDGILTITPDLQGVTWTPNSGGPPTVSLPVSKITNLQQTPDGAPKVMLKIFEQNPSGGDPVTYLFHFNTDEAKKEASSFKDVLSRLLSEARGSDPNVPRPVGSSTPQGAPGTGGSASATMAFASAANSQQSSARWFDDQQLKNDIELQRSLMKKDLGLNETYMDALTTKPESISVAAFNSQFWSTRTNLLRAHAIESNQKKGPYNVLSTVKPRTVDGEMKLNISVEQVQMIFAQHPLVKRIYNENVPKLSEADFWSRFFLSRLSKKLRGERVTDNDTTDAIFDKYDVNENLQNVQSKIMSQHVPHIIDIEANEENQGGFKSGNAKDVEMRPRANIPIVQTLNSLSEKIMANVAPSDTPNDDRAEYYRELALRDLRGDAEERRIMLNVKEQNKFFAKHDSAPSSNAKVFSKQDPSSVLLKMQGTFNTVAIDFVAGVNLQAAIDFDDGSDSDDEEPPRKKPSSSRRAIIDAEKDVLNGITQRRAQKYGNGSENDATTTTTTPMGLPAPIAERCALTHATTVEFLHQFWDAFLSGDPDRAGELQYLAESLRRSSTRINAVADEAATERDEAVRRAKQEIRDHFERTGKKIRWKPDMVGGGRDAVVALMQPTLDALQKAQADYARALAAEGVQVSTEA